MSRQAPASTQRRPAAWWNHGGLRVAIAVALLAWLSRSIDWRQLAGLSRHIRWQFVAIAILLHLTNRWLTTTKWTALLKVKGFSYPFTYLLRVVWVSNFLGHFLPSAIGGDNIRMLTLAYRNERSPEAVSTVLMERFTGTMSLAVLAILGACWSYEYWGRPDLLVALTIPLGLLLGGLALLWTTPGSRVFIWLLDRFRRVPGAEFLRKVHEAIRAYQHHLGVVLGALAVSVVIQLNRVLSVYLLAHALGMPLLFRQALVLIPTILFISMLPISIAGLGLQEGAFVVLLRLAGIATSSAFGLSILFRFVTLISNLPGGAMLLLQGMKRQPKQAATERTPITVLHVTDKLGYGGRWHGVGRLLYNILPAFDRNQVRVVACVLRERNGLDAKFHQRGVTLYNLHRGKVNPLAMLDLWRLIRREQVDLMHLHGYGSTTIGRIVGALTGTPVVIHQHDADLHFPWYVGFLDRCLAPTTGRAVAVSQEAAEFCATRRSIDWRRTKVLPCAVSLEEFNVAHRGAEEVRVSLGLPQDRYIIGSVTRFREEKGVEYLIQAFARVIRVHPEATLVLVGDGPERQALEQLAHRLGVNHAVQFLGFREDVAELLTTFDIFVLPSITEGSPLALLEAMAAGKPIVASRVGGIRGTIQDGVNGRLTPPADPVALAGVIEELLSDSAQTTRLALAARTTSQRFSTDVLTHELVRIYDDVLHGRNGHANTTGAPHQPDRRPVRVLWLADKLGYGDRLHDVGQYFLNIYPVLEGVEVVPAVLRCTDELANQLRGHGLPLRQLRHGRFDLRTLWALIRYVKHERVDVLHLHGYGASTFGRVVGWLTRTPAIIHQYDSMSHAPWYARLTDRLLSRATARAIAVSESVKQFCVEERAIPSQQILVWHNGVTVARQPVDPARRTAIRRRLQIPEHHQVIGTLVRLTIDKGVRCLIEAAGRILQAMPEATIVVIGDGPERRRLEAATARLGINDRVRFLGFREDATELLSAFDCFVLPSLTEGSSFALLEAMGAGLPIVATAVGGTTDLLQHQKTGYLVRARDPRALADGILDVLSDSDLCAHLSANARAASHAYDVHHHARKLAALYRQALEYQSPRESHHPRSWTTRFRALIRYSIVGVSGGAIHFSLLWLLVERVRWPVLVATTIGFVAAVANNFLLNRIWTFKSKERNIRLQFTRFLVVSLCGMAINDFGMATFVHWLGWSYLIAQLFATGAVWWWNFLANTYWTFQPIQFRTPKMAQGYRYELSMVIPAYNEEKRLGRTMDALAMYVRSRQLRAELVIVDDGSADGTLAVATQRPVDGVDVRVIYNPTNRGKGAVVREGFRAAEGEYVLMADADNSIPIECLDAFLPQRNQRRILIGSRYVNGRRRQPDVPKLRYWVGRIGNWIIRGFLLPEIQDTQCGFKLFSASAAKAVATRQRITGFGFDMELLAIARALGIDVREVAVRWTPIPGSRVRPIRDAGRVLGELMRIKGYLWCGFYHTQQPIDVEMSAERLGPKDHTPAIGQPTDALL